MQGATRVDERFLQHLGDKFGDNAAQQWLKNPAHAEDVQELVYDEWEVCKCCFVGEGASSSSCTTVNLPFSLVASAETSGGYDCDR